MEFDLFNDLLKFFYILADICQQLYEWLFTEINIFGYTITPIAVGGVVVIAIMIIKLVA